MELDMGKKQIIVEQSDEIESDDVAVIEDTEEVAEETTEVEEENTEESAEKVAEEEADTVEEELVISIAGEEPSEEEEEQKNAPGWVRELRKSSREKDKKIRELESKLQAAGGQATPKIPALGKKPTLDDHDYDPDAYEAALTGWFDRKRIHDTHEAQVLAQQEESQRAWESKLANYGKSKAELKVKDFDDAESYIQEKFNVTQQGIMIQGLENPALMVYALGKNPKKAAEVSAIQDPVKFAIAIGKLESTLKVTPRKSAPPPTRSITGNGPVSGSIDSTLNRLRAEAEKTGDYTKVMAYKRQKKA
jgi:hypothetical protein